MKNFISILFMQIPTLLLAQDTLFFDAEWKEATAGQHFYYRLLPLKKVGELLFIQDFYKDGTLQMQGYVLASDESSYVGDAYWYDAAGLDQSTKQSINRSGVTELHYYHQDGSLWKTICYGANGRIQKVRVYLNGGELAVGEISEGNIYQGNFSREVPDPYYDNASAVPDTPVETTTAPPPDELFAQDGKSDEIAYTETIYWSNGKRASEKQFNRYHALQHTTHWDKEGRVRSNFNFDESGTGFLYYTRNGFAVGVRTEDEREDAESSERLVKSYSSDGALLSKSRFINGKLEEITHYENGKQKSTQTYRDNEPFDGFFVKDLGTKVTEYWMRDGEIIGDVTTRDLATDTIFAKGAYKDGQPFDGFFYMTEDTYQLLQYRNGKQEGLQIDYADYLGEEPAEKYEMKAGVRDGLATTYRQGKLLLESIYKNGKVISGGVLEGNQQLTYTDGDLVERITYDGDAMGETIKREYFEQEKLAKVVYSDFTIEEKPQETYVGFYRDGNPYEGYFKLDTLVDNIALISYLEKGALRSKYSLDLLEQMDNFRHYTYNQKTTYKDQQVVDGPVYRMIGRERLLCSYYAEGKLRAFDLNLFAMHYFNKLTVKLSENELLLTELVVPLQIKAYVKSGKIVADLIYDGKLLTSSAPSAAVVEGRANSLTRYYVEGGRLKTAITALDNDEEQHALDETEGLNNALLRELFYVFNVQKFSDLQQVFNQLYENVQQDDVNAIFEIDRSELFPDNPEKALTYLHYNEQGKAFEGIRLTVQQDQKILAEAIKNGVVMESKTFDSLKHLLESEQKELKDLQHRTFDAIQ
ncbi:hypothetical protein [Sphingobacterium deserti]|uniref:MORN variant repeat-containing protein n=1 Tax=Sphingobacterium deserti TaxID=1229276 RepID=A0A0B8T5P4_9SPHI|nr:hypothetical protein [Sphingobacterium deserti]KGE16003.1 hypothetical protein DI53_0118 [Sphingobacterium deserti]